MQETHCAPDNEGLRSIAEETTMHRKEEGAAAPMARQNQMKRKESKWKRLFTLNHVTIAYTIIIIASLLIYCLFEIIHQLFKTLL